MKNEEQMKWIKEEGEFKYF